MRGRHWRGVAATLVVLASACSASSSHRVVLDGRARYPDAEGVVVSVTPQQLTLDGGRTYRVSSVVQSFSSETLATVPLLQRSGQYVQVGLDGRTAVWVAAVGAVFTSSPPLVYYQGVLVRIDAKRRAVFRDGTVLQLKPGVPGAAPGFARAEIDPAAHLVVRLADL